MAESTGVRNKRDGISTLSDSAGAHTYIFAQEPGDVSVTVPGDTVSLYLDRGIIGATPSIRLVDEQPMTIGFSVYMRDIADVAVTKTYTTALDLAWRFTSGYAASTWVSTLSNYSDVPTYTYAWLVDGSIFGEADKTLTFPFCFLTANAAEGDPNMVTMSMTSYAAKPTVA